MENDKLVYPPEPDPTDPLAALSFKVEYHEIMVDVDGTKYPFTVQGLSQFEIEEIASEATTEMSVDEKTGKPKARLNQGLFYQLILMKGVTRAPPRYKWTDKNVKRLLSVVRDQLLKAIMDHSDGMDAFKKKSKES